MPRPRLRRWVRGIPKATYFKPQGIPLLVLEEILLPLEGLEALRLADLEGLTTEAGAVAMGVSRHTFGRVLTEARARVARALVTGAALRIEGGHYELAGEQNRAANREGLSEDAAARTAAADARATDTVEVDGMRQDGGGQAGRGGSQSGGGSGQGRCGQRQGRGGGQAGRGGGRCGQGRGQGGGAGGPTGKAASPPGWNGRVRLSAMRPDPGPCAGIGLRRHDLPCLWNSHGPAITDNHKENAICHAVMELVLLDWVRARDVPWGIARARMPRALPVRREAASAGFAARLEAAEAAVGVVDAAACAGAVSWRRDPRPRTVRSRRSPDVWISRADSRPWRRPWRPSRPIWTARPESGPCSRLPSRHGDGRRAVWNTESTEKECGMGPGMLDAVRRKAVALWEKHELLREPIAVKARTLTVHEAIGDPEGNDFPLQKGKERLMEAEFRGAKGQAFTDRFGDFTGTLSDVATMPLENNFRRAVFVASVNATVRGLGLCDRTIHCRDKEPGECAAQFREHLRERYGKVRITQVGFQPKIIEALGEAFELKVLDLDPDNIGTTQYQAAILGPESRDEALAWADLLVVTGSTLANDTIGDFLVDRPVIFYGTTVAGAAALMGWERFCAKAL